MWVRMTNGTTSRCTPRLCTGRTCLDLGASVFRGLEGYGASSRIHSARILSLSEDLPLAVVIVDREERIREFLSSRLDELQIDGLIVLEDVEVIRYAGRDRSSR